MSKRVVDYSLRVVPDTGEAKGEMDTLDASAASMASGFAAAGAAAVSAVGAIVGAVTGAAYAVHEMTAAMVDQVDQINTMGAATGLANSTVAALGQAAAATGKSIDQLVPKDIGKAIVETANGTGRAAKGFRGLGLEAAILSGELSTADDVLFATLDALQAIEDPTRRAGLATQVFGEQGKQMLSAFDGADSLRSYVALVDKYGTDVSADAVASTGLWQASMANLGLAIDHARNTLVEMVGGPASMAAMVNGVAGGLVGITSLLEAFVTDWVTRLLKLGEVMQQVLGVDALRRLMTGDIRGAMNAYADGLQSAFETVANGEVFDPSMLFDEYPQMVSDAIAEGFNFAELAGAAGAAGQSLGRAIGAGVTDGVKAGAVEGAKAVSQGAALPSDVSFESGSQGVQGRGPVEVKAEVTDEGADKIGHKAGVIMSTFVAPIVALPGMIGGVTDTIASLPGAIADIPLKIVGLVEALGQVVPALMETIPQAILTLITELPEALAVAIVETLKSFLGLDGDFLAQGQKGRDARREALGRSNFGQAAANAGIDVAGAEDIRVFGVKVPFLDTGGSIYRSGLAYVHEGEEVRNRAQQASSGGPSVVFSGNIVTPDPSAFVQQLQRHIGPYGMGRPLIGTQGMG